MEKVASTVMFPCRYQQSGKYYHKYAALTKSEEFRVLLEELEILVEAFRELVEANI